MSSSNSEENPYDVNTLEDVIDEVTKKFHSVIKSGIPEKGIPVLDPLDLGKVSFPIKNDKIDVTFTLNNATCTGLDSLSVSSKPNIDFENIDIGLFFKIKEIQVSSDDYDREGTVKPLFMTYDASKFDRALTITLSDIDINLSLDFDFSDIEKPKIFLKEDNKINIGHLKTALEDSFVFDLFSPLLKGVVANKLNDFMKKQFEPILNEKFQEVCEKQVESIKTLEKIYKEKQKQGLLVDKEGNPIKPQFLKGFGGIGQIGVPMFWEVTSPALDTLPRMKWDEVVKTAKTGDVLLCSNIAPGSLMIRRFTQSPFSHVIMVVKEDKILDGKTVLIQATSHGLYDLIQKKAINGCQVNDPDEWFPLYKEDSTLGEKDNINLCFRRLQAKEERSKEEHEKWVEKLKTFIEETNNIPYAEGSEMTELYIMGIAEIDLDKQEGTDDDRTFYCASYVAQALMEFGILETKFMSHQYGPRDFSQKYDVLPLMGSFNYGPESLIVE